MIPAKEKIALELKKARIIWKDLVNERQPDVKRISDIFSRYKLFLEDNKELIRRNGNYAKEIDVVETLLNHYEELSASREKKILLHDMYLGLMFDLSESIDELKARMEGEAYSASEQIILN